MERDLMILANDHTALARAKMHFPDLAQRFDVVIDRRYLTRRKARGKVPGEDRRRADRRWITVSDWLRREGWAVIPAEQRRPDEERGATPVDVQRLIA